MKTKRTLPPYVFTASVLFGIYFGAGNLIFPISLGQKAGNHLVPAFAGFLITAVGLIFIGTLSLALSKEKELKGVGDQVAPWFGTFISMALALTIGPLFAIPRTGAVSFEMALGTLVPAASKNLWQLGFSLVFFSLVLVLSIKPNKLLLWIGKVLNPLFLTFLFVLIITAFVNPIGDFTQRPPSGAYETQPFFTGFLAGYETMDALGVFLFGFVAIETLHQQGVKKGKDITFQLMKAGAVTVGLMGFIYFALSYMGAGSTNVLALEENGALTLAQISQMYFGPFGHILLSLIITLACLKTAVGLITSCGQTFARLFKKGPQYKHYVFIFTFVSFFISNIGLNQIIQWSTPVLMFLYPINIALMLLGLTATLVKGKSGFYRVTILFTAIAALGDCLKMLPQQVQGLFIIQKGLALYEHLPLFSKGLGWLMPMVIGMAIGLAFDYIYLNRKKTMAKAG